MPGNETGKRVGFSSTPEGPNFFAKPVRAGTQRVVGEMGVTLGCCCCRVSEEPADDLQAEAARNEMGCICVPVVAAP